MGIEVRYDRPLWRTLVATGAGLGQARRENELLEFRAEQQQQRDRIRAMNQLFGQINRGYERNQYNRALLDRQLIRDYGTTLDEIDAARGNQSRTEFLQQLATERQDAEFKQKLEFERAKLRQEMEAKGFIEDYTDYAKGEMQRLATDRDTLIQRFNEGEIDQLQLDYALKQNAMKRAGIKKSWMPAPPQFEPEKKWKEFTYENPDDGEVYGATIRNGMVSWSRISDRARNSPQTEPTFGDRLKAAKRAEEQWNFHHPEGLEGGAGPSAEELKRMEQQILDESFPESARAKERAAIQQRAAALQSMYPAGGRITTVYGQQQPEMVRRWMGGPAKQQKPEKAAEPQTAAQTALIHLQAISVEQIGAGANPDDPSTWSKDARERAKESAKILAEDLRKKYPDTKDIPPGLRPTAILVARILSGV